MVGRITDKANTMFGSLAAVQTLVENFPMNLISFGDLKYYTSFDLLSILFKKLGVSREELIEVVTDALCGNKEEDTEGSGFIAYVEEIVKMAIEANIMNIMNCTTNPIISNNLLDVYEVIGTSEEKSGDGITINVSEIDFTGVLNRNPFTESKFYFDVEGKTPRTLHESKDFNVFLWYIINKSDKSQTTERIWNNRYRAKIYGEGNGKLKEIIKCTYNEENSSNSDSITIHLCSSNYYKTRQIGNFKLNKTIFEFNHEFLSSIKLYESKVIIAEIVEYLLGNSLNVNLGFSLNEQIIQGKIQQIIKKIIEADDMEVNDCFFSFSNEEFNNMLEQAEQSRYNVINNGNGFYEVNPNDILNNLTGITSNSSLIEDKNIIKKTLTDITAIPAQDPSAEVKLKIDYDWEFELLRALVYPFIRPLFTPKVMFILMVNRKIMGSFEEIDNFNANDLLDKLMNSLFMIIKDIIIKLKDIIIDLFLKLIMDKIKPLLVLMASKLLLESLQMYKDLLTQILDCLILFNVNLPNFNNLNGNLDNVKYADIINNNLTTEQTEPNQSIC